MELLLDRFRDTPSRALFVHEWIQSWRDVWNRDRHVYEYKGKMIYKRKDQMLRILANVRIDLGDRIWNDTGKNFSWTKVNAGL